MEGNNTLKILGARAHNLKNINLELPLEKLICFAGPSGSGKTSLAFHTLLKESKRRFISSFPNALKLFSERPPAVDVDSISPVLPVFGLPQINPVVSSRQNVSDSMGLTELIQSLYFHHSVELCPFHQVPLVETSLEDLLQEAYPAEAQEDIVLHLLVPKEIYQQKVASRVLPSRSWDQRDEVIRDFVADDEFWEIGRVKSSQLSKARSYLEENGSEIFSHFLLHPSKTKKLIPVKLEKKKKCPVAKCTHVGTKSFSYELFSPFNAQGACSFCQGFGAKLEFDREKLFTLEKSIHHGGMRLFSSKHFKHLKASFLKNCEKKKIDQSILLRQQSEDFWNWTMNGDGKAFEGFQSVLDYLTSKMYKPSVRMFVRQLQTEVECKHCELTRLNKEVHFFAIPKQSGFLTLKSVYQMKVGDLKLELSNLLNQKKEKQKKELDKDFTVERDLLERLIHYLGHASQLGTDHLELFRKTKTLSAGEYQRLVLVRYLSYQGTDSLFIFDEPSLGLGIKELNSLVDGLREITKQGNTVIVIDHSEFLQKKADHLVIMGPESGHAGGEVMFSGVGEKYFSSLKESIKNEAKSDRAWKKVKLLELKGIQVYGKDYPDVTLYQKGIHWVTGPSGSGKTSVMTRLLANELNFKISGEYLDDKVGSFKELKTYMDFDSVLVMDAMVRRVSSRSTVGSFTEMNKAVRVYFSKLPEAKDLHLTDSHFTPNTEAGRCSSCLGSGRHVVEMQYMEDVEWPCEECEGSGLNQKYAKISDGKISFFDAWMMPLEKLNAILPFTGKFNAQRFQSLKKLNLTHLAMGREVSSLSGGERQRLALHSYLSKSPKDSLIVLENISFGLSKKELLPLISYLEEITSLNNIILVIDQNEFFERYADVSIRFQK
ncbi:MAG: hypothetical protein QE271_13770 [Bacteriovoracaceae bacterium]|nr:hypothetical protein [Bacteriovoracaceae bacterium]